MLNYSIGGGGRELNGDPLIQNELNSTIDYCYPFVITHQVEFYVLYFSNRNIWRVYHQVIVTFAKSNNFYFHRKVKSSSLTAH